MSQVAQTSYGQQQVVRSYNGGIVVFQGKNSFLETIFYNYVVNPGTAFLPCLKKIVKAASS